MRSTSVDSGRRDPDSARRRAAALAAGVALTLILAGLATAAEMRTWTDLRGKFKIQAKYVSQENGKVTLEKADGSEIAIELRKLCTADQKYVAGLKDADDNPFKPADEDPFKPKAKGAGAAAGTGAVGAAGPRVVTPDWSAARAVDAVPSSTQWSVTVGTPIDAALKLKGTKPIPIPPKGNFFEKARALVVNPVSKRAVIGYTTDEPRPAGLTRLVLCDLENGKRLGVGAAPGKFLPLALHDDGTRLLVRTDEDVWGNGRQLEIWSLTEAAIKKTLQFAPYADVAGDEGRVHWAAFVDAKTLATVSAGGKLAVWDLATVKPRYSLQVQKMHGAPMPAISPDRKFLAFTTDKEVGLLDIAAGEVVALGPKGREFTPWPTLSFSPSGKRLACTTNDRIFVHDTATGAVYREIAFQGVPGPYVATLWPDDEDVLLGRQTLINLETQVKLWTYEAFQGHELVEAAGGLCWFEVPGSPGALVPARVPHPAAKAALEKALADPTFFVLKPGVTVVVDTNALPDFAQRDRVRDALTARLKANGVQVGPGGTITLSATTEVGKEGQHSYHTFGRGDMTYTLREHWSKVRFLYQGQPVWESSGTNVPFTIQGNPTPEEYRRDHEKPNYAFFDHVELPKLLTKPTGAPTLGASKVSVAGLR